MADLELTNNYSGNSLTTQLDTKLTCARANSKRDKPENKTAEKWQRAARRASVLSVDGFAPDEILYRANNSRIGGEGDGDGSNGHVVSNQGRDSIVLPKALPVW